jgi:hypothetical protein
MELRASLVTELERFSSIINEDAAKKNFSKGKWLVYTIINQNCDRTYIEEVIKYYVSSGELHTDLRLIDLMDSQKIVFAGKDNHTYSLELYPEKGKFWTYGYLHRLVYYLDNLEINQAAFYRHIFDVCEYLAKNKMRKDIWRSVGMAALSVLPIALLFILPRFIYPKGEPVVESGE